MRRRPRQPRQSQGHRRCGLALMGAIMIGLLHADPAHSQECWANQYRRFPNFATILGQADAACPHATDLACPAVVYDYSVRSLATHECCFPQTPVSSDSFSTDSWQCCQMAMTESMLPGTTQVFACPSGTKCWTTQYCGDYDCCLPGEVPLLDVYHLTTGEFAGCHSRCCPVNHVLCPGLTWSLSVMEPEMGNSYCCSNERFCDEEGFCQEPSSCDPVCWGSDLLSQLPSASWPSVRLTLPSTCTAAQRERAALKGAVPANTKATWNCPTFGGLVASQSRSSTCSHTTKKWTEPQACPGLLTVMPSPTTVPPVVMAGSKPLVFDPTFVQFATDFFSLAHTLKLRMLVGSTIRQLYQELKGADASRKPEKAAKKPSSHFTGHAIDNIFDIHLNHLYLKKELGAINPTAKDNVNLPVAKFINQLGAKKKNNANNPVRWGGWFHPLDGVHFDDGDDTRSGTHEKRTLQVQAQLLDMCSAVSFLDATTQATLVIKQFGSTVCTGKQIGQWQSAREEDTSVDAIAALISGAVLNLFPTLSGKRDVTSTNSRSTSNSINRRLLQENQSSTGTADSDSEDSSLSFIASRRGSAGTDLSWQALLEVTSADFDLTIITNGTDEVVGGSNDSNTTTVTLMGPTPLMGLLDALLQVSINGTTAALQAYAAQWNATTDTFDLSTAQQLQGASTGALGNLSQAVASLGIISYNGLADPSGAMPEDDEYVEDGAALLNLTQSNFSVTWPPWCPSGPDGPIDLTSASVQVNDTDDGDAGSSTAGEPASSDSTGTDIVLEGSTGSEVQPSTGGSSGGQHLLPDSADVTASPPSRAVIAAAAVAVMAAAMIQRYGAQ